MELSFNDFCTTVLANTDRAPVILTANQRQSRQVASTIHRAFLHDTITEVSALPLSTWLNDLWLTFILSDQDSDASMSSSILINDFEATLTWSQVVANSDSLPTLVNTQDFIDQLQRAYDISAAYMIPDEELRALAFDETLSFLQHRDDYLQTLKMRKCVDKYMFLDFLCKHGVKLIHEDVYLYGFSEIAPLYQKALTQICGAALNRVSYPIKNSQTEVYEFDTHTNEILFAAQWAKQKVQDHVSSHNPESVNKEVAIVVPDLLKDRYLVEQALFKTLEPENYCASGSSPIPSLFDISAGQALDSFGLIKTAYLLPKLSDSRIDKEELRFLLQSPFWLNESNKIEKQALLAALATSNEQKINLFQLINKVLPADTHTEQYSLDFDPNSDPNSDQNATQTLSLLIQSARRAKEKLRGQRRYDAWVTLFEAYLNMCGFPGEQALSSLEYQLSKRFFQSLQELKQLDKLNATSVGWHAFYSALQTNLKHAVFQVEVEEPPVKVLGLMEAAGLTFDECLVIGLTDHVLPPAANPHPFLPITLQKAYNTPKSSAARELDYAERFLEALLISSEKLYLSYHRSCDDEVREPSPLLHAFIDRAEALPVRPNTFDSLCTQALHFDDYEWVPVGLAPVIPEAATISGGAYALDLHWQNPIFGFFKYRLRIDEPEHISLGLSYRDRGNLVHSFLHRVYTEYDSSEKIVELLADSEYTAHLQAMAHTELSQSHFTFQNAPTMFTFEVNHLVDIAQQALLLDSNRAPSFKIAALEKQCEMTIFNRTLRTRIDRLDAMEDGLLVIDYKTGTSSLSGVTKQNLSDHQLPLYFFALGEAPIALSYMDVHAWASSFKGIAACDINIPGIQLAHKLPRSELPDDWANVASIWKASIETNVNQIIHGEVPFLPRVKSKQAFHTHYLFAIRPEEFEHPDE